MTSASAPRDARPGDRPGWQLLPAALKDYERARAGAHAHLHVVRPADVTALETLLAGGGR